MIDFLLWGALSTLTGWLAFPLAYRMLPFLRDRGVAFLRPLGLLLSGYVFWLLASLQALRNDPGSILFSLAVIAGLSAWAGRGLWSEMRAWLRANRGMVLAMESLFLGAFALWALVRAMNPAVHYTESSMELAFINSILRSDAFPPRDPWFSGYGISYYYFGYVLTAMQARLLNIPGEIAFNLAHAQWFAMTAAAAYGVVYTLLAHAIRERDGQSAKAAARRWAGLAPLFVLLVSNLEGFLASLRARGLLGEAFWSWLGILDLTEAPLQPLSWVPHRTSGWPWWRASRVMYDYRLFSPDQPIEMIDEFPFFSYLIGDLHPHVLSMPFVLLAAALALNLYLGWRRDPQPVEWWQWLRRAEFWLGAVALGGLAFLNTWDFPIYVGLYSAAFALRQYELGVAPRKAQWLRDFLILGLMTGAAGGALYLPFYLGFQSQAGGVLPSLVFFTRGRNFWVMLAPVLLPAAAWLVYLWRRSPGSARFPAGLKFAGAVTLGLWVLMLVMGMMLLNLVPLGQQLAASGGFAAALGERLAQGGQALLGVHGVSQADTGRLLLASVTRRFIYPGMWVSVFLLLVLTWALIAGRRTETQNGGGNTPSIAEPGSGFVLLMALLGLGLVLFPEFLYLRDQFGTRMNTIFKFYFQAWILFALAGAYGSALLLRELRGAGGWAFRAGWAVLVAMSLVFPLFMLPAKTNNFRPAQFTLDASVHIQRRDPGLRAAMAWLREAPTGVLAEGVTESYSYEQFRYSVFSGMPAVVGWPGHESQWGRDPAEIQTRRQDMERLYTTTNWQEARQVLEKYGVRYVAVGPNERSLYRVSENKFTIYLQTVYKNESVTIYEVPENLWRDSQLAVYP